MRFYIGAVGDWSYANATEIVDFVRFPHDTPLESSAEGADAAVAGWIIEDSQGVYNVQGLLPAWVDEDDVETAPDDSTTGIRIWSGFVTVRRWKRAEGYRSGPARLIEVDLFDINTLLKRHAIVTADGKRPAELDSARIDWVLGGVLDGIVFDNGLLDYSGPAIMLEEADYRDNYAVDVLGDAGAISAKDFYVIWDSSAPTGQEVTLVYEQRSATQRVASLGISNVRTDQNLDDIWEPSWDSVLERSPENVYSGVDQVYLGGNRVYLQNPTTLADFFGTAENNLSLDLVVSSSRIGKTATATSQALLQLQIHAMEKDIIECRLFLPVSRVNWVMAGQSVLFRASHMDGYETFQTMKVLRKSVIHPWPDRRRFYEVALRLANGEAGEPVAGGGGGNPPPDDFPPPDVGCTPTVNLLHGDFPGALSGTRAERYVGGTRMGYEPLAPVEYNSGGRATDEYYGQTGMCGNSAPYDPEMAVAFAFFGIGGPGGPDIERRLTIKHSTPVTAWGFRVYPASTVGFVFPTEFQWSADSTDGINGSWSGPLGFSVTGPIHPPGDCPASTVGYYLATLDGDPIETATFTRYSQVIPDPPGPVVGVLANTWWEVALMECEPGAASPPAPAQWVRDIKVADGDGTTTSFASPFPFADGSLHVRYDTVDQTPAIASYDGVAGTFVMQGPPLDGQQVFIDIQGR